MELIIVSGVSGSGKSKAVAALEDMGYFCIDNLPTALIPSLIDIYKKNHEDLKKLAVVIDSRIHGILGQQDELWEQLSLLGLKTKILFLDADDTTIIHRYKETRRLHPLITTNTSLEDAIIKERDLLKGIKDNADFYIDTSVLSTSKFKEKMVALFGGDLSPMSINCVSFGFKYGIPVDSDLIFDVRCLPNPFYIPQLKHKTGFDSEVYDFVMESNHTKELVKRITDYLDYTIPLYEGEGKSQLTLSIGCTGGKHRSVSVTRAINDYLSTRNCNSFATHRDIDKE